MEFKYTSGKRVSQSLREDQILFTIKLFSAFNSLRLKVKKNVKVGKGLVP